MLVGLASSGLHTNGYSLARRIVAERLRLGVRRSFSRANGYRRPTCCCGSTGRTCSAARPVLDRVHAMAHITGGGLPGNVNRALPDALDAVDRHGELDSAERVSGSCETAGQVSRDEMFRTFNMGVGMVVITDAAMRGRGRWRARASAGVDAWRLGRVVRGSGQVDTRLRSFR